MPLPISRRTTVEIVPFGAAHVAAAARLLASRHMADRTRAPLLPEPHQTNALVASLAEWPGSSGVAALRTGQLAGYLLGSPMNVGREDALAGFFRPDSMRVSYAGHAVDQRGGPDLYRAMYAVAAQTWVDAGHYVHYLQVPATDREALDAWMGLGFGQDMGLALRDTSPLNVELQSLGLTFRRATPADLELVVAMLVELARFEAGSPVFFPFFPESVPHVREECFALLHDAGCVVWLAERGEDVLGLMSLLPPPRHISPLLTPENTLNLGHAVIRSDLRGSGVGAALLNHVLSSARSAGHDFLRLSWMTANPLSSRFWRQHGFQPIMYRLCRVVDDRRSMS